MDCYIVVIATIISIIPIVIIGYTKNSKRKEWMSYVRNLKSPLIQGKQNEIIKEASRNSETVKSKGGGKTPPPSNNEDVIVPSPLFVGIDCEMVGVGRRGIESALARCSIVTIHDGDTNDVIVLYDAYVKPVKKVTDYRTQWSGITPQHLSGRNVKSLDECRHDVTDIISSAVGDAKIVIIVGHSLENDFKVLKLKVIQKACDILGCFVFKLDILTSYMCHSLFLQHPQKLVRDTATYPPFMRLARKRLYPRKLSHLAKDFLDIDIQKNGRTNINAIGKDGNKNCKNHDIGHSSIEDAAAALLLYTKVSHDWEAMLGCPFRKAAPNTNASSKLSRCGSQTESFITLYLDGCNLPIGLRRKKGCESTVDGSWKYQLISKTHVNGTTQVRTKVDWIPIFKSILSYSSLDIASYQNLDIPPIAKIVAMFDGASFKMIPEGERPRAKQTLDENIYLEVTNQDVEVDDVLIDRCRADLTSDDNSKVTSLLHRQIVTVDEVIALFSHDSVIHSEKHHSLEKVCLDSYVIVRRKGGGRKSNRKLFEKLNLRRPEEGALCLLPSFFCNSDRLRRNSLQIAKELKRANVQQLVEYEIRQCRNVREIVVTDDVLLADRVVSAGAIVMNYRQLQQLF